MPKTKMKTRKSAAKRYNITATGKIKYKKKGMGHIMTKKSSKRKRQLGKMGVLSEAETKRVHKLLPYS